VEPQVVPQLAAEMKKHGMRLSAFCTRCFDLTDPSRRDAYLEGLRSALTDAETLGATALITQVGMDTGADRTIQHQSIVDGLNASVPLLEAAGVTLLVEPLNIVKDHVGYYLWDSDEAFDLIRQVGSPCVKVLFDVYHQLHMGEPVEDRIRVNLPLIGHVHVAGWPDRDDRLFETHSHDALFRLFDSLGYAGLVGLELFPRPGSLQTLLDGLEAYRT
jgi:hydroxypyruvate isomerase